MSKYEYNELVFSEIGTEEEAYWLGFLIADGYNHNNKCLRVDIKDKGHLEHLSKLIYPNGDKPIQIRDLGYGDIYMFSCGISRIVENLNKHGVIPRKSMKTKLPNINREMYRHFIRGLFDGDGSIGYTMAKNSPNYRRYQYSIVGNFELMEGIKDIIQQEIDVDIKLYKMKMIHRVIKKGNQSIMKILKWLYEDSNIYLERKYNKYCDMLEYYDNKKSKGGK
jgi:hypothetical protein